MALVSNRHILSLSHNFVYIFIKNWGKNKSKGQEREKRKKKITEKGKKREIKKY